MEKTQPRGMGPQPDATVRKVIMPDHISCNVEQCLHAAIRARIQLIKSGPAMQMSDLCSAALRLVLEMPGWEDLVMQRAFERVLARGESHPKYNRVPLHEAIVAKFVGLYESQRANRARIVFQTGEFVSAALDIVLGRSDAAIAIRTQVLRQYSGATILEPPLRASQDAV